ncbi:MAG: hypothetical protein ABI772_02425, partial [Bacteroidota bacterium]
MISGITFFSKIKQFKTITTAFANGIRTTGINEITKQPFYFSDVASNPFTLQLSFSVLMLQPGKLKITLTNT